MIFLEFLLIYCWGVLLGWGNIGEGGGGVGGVEAGEEGLHYTEFCFGAELVGTEGIGEAGEGGVGGSK